MKVLKRTFAQLMGALCPLTLLGAQTLVLRVPICIICWLSYLIVLLSSSCFCSSDWDGAADLENDVIDSSETTEKAC